MHFRQRQHAADRRRRGGRIEIEAEHLQLLLGARIVHLQLHHEAIDLRFRKRVRPLVFDRILRGDHHERIGKRVRRLTDGHLPLLHGFQKCALHFGRSAVDLVGENQIGEDRSEAGVEAAAGRIEDQRAGDVGRQKIGRELDALERSIDRRRERFHQQANRALVINYEHSGLHEA